MLSWREYHRLRKRVLTAGSPAYLQILKAVYQTIRQCQSSSAITFMSVTQICLSICLSPVSHTDLSVIFISPLSRVDLSLHLPITCESYRSVYNFHFTSQSCLSIRHLPITCESYKPVYNFNFLLGWIKYTVIVSPSITCRKAELPEGCLSLCLLLTETIHFDLLRALIFFSQCEKLPQGGGGEVGGIQGGVRGGGGNSGWGQGWWGEFRVGSGEVGGIQGGVRGGGGNSGWGQGRWGEFRVGSGEVGGIQGGVRGGGGNSGWGQGRWGEFRVGSGEVGGIQGGVRGGGGNSGWGQGRWGEFRVGSGEVGAQRWKLKLHLLSWQPPN